jgi:hypothetical protein
MVMGRFPAAADALGSTVNLQVEHFSVASEGSIGTSTAEIGPAPTNIEP